MRGNNGVKFFSIIFIIGILTYITVYGSLFTWKVPGAAKDIRLGIDIKGGVHTTLYPPENVTPTSDQLETAKSIIEKRLDNRGIFDRTVTIENDKGRIIIEIPWAQDEKEFNPQKSVDEIGKTALLTFQEVDEDKKDQNGNYLPTGRIVLQGTDVVDAQPEKSTQSGAMEVSLKLNATGATKFEEATGRLVGKRIAVFMDDQLIVAPTVQTKISGGSAVITGQRDTAEAKDLANTIRSGSLPFKLEAREINSISPQLGEGALRVSIQAGIVSFILVCIFMLGYYRLPGILANLALLGHTVIQLLFISWFGVTLTLPGIAGIILTIGMGVDANVIIFERVKEELRNGKTLRAAIDVGFKRAFAAVFDANMTVLITAVVLYMFGTGPIKGFAITLALGVILSFLTAVTASRIMLKSMAGVDIAKHHWLYGA